MQPSRACRQPLPVYLCWGFLISQSSSFVPLTVSIRSRHHGDSSHPSSTPPLYGVGESLRRTFSAMRLPPSPPAPAPPTSPITQVLIPESKGSSHITGGSLVRLSNDDRLYSLPEIPDDRNLNELELEFRDMLEHFTRYSKRDIFSLRDPRMRVLFQGVAASAYEPEVYRAFEILYEDLYPLRVAGRIFFGRMKQLMSDSQLERQEQVIAVHDATGLSAETVEDIRLAFVSTAATLNGDIYLTFDQLAETGLAGTAVNVLDFDSVDSLLQRLDKGGIGKLSFVDFMAGLQQCAEETCAIETCNPSEVIKGILSDLEDNPPHAGEELDPQRQKFSDRFDEMVDSFREWGDLVPQGEGRRLDVVRGCFVGAGRLEIVDALRIVYVDFKALRFAGDLIFKLVSSVMAGIRRRQT